MLRKENMFKKIVLVMISLCMISCINTSNSSKKILLDMKIYLDILVHLKAIYILKIITKVSEKTYGFNRVDDSEQSFFFCS